MKLHTGKLYWPSTLPDAPTYPALSQELQCEVLVVGGGVGGALCAYLLAERGVDTVLVERDRIAGGSTLASTGLLQYASDKPLTSMIHTFGEEPAVHFYRLSRNALERLKQIASKLDGSARFTERSTIYLASSEQDVDALQEECGRLQRLGFPAVWWSAGDIADRFPFQAPGAIYTKGDAEMNPYTFVHGILREAARQGVRIFEHSPMHGSQRDEGGRIRCRCGGGTVTAQHVIWATGYEAQQFKKESGAHFRASYVIVTEPVASLNSWYEKSLIWETARPYLYMRTTYENNAGWTDYRRRAGRGAFQRRTACGPRDPTKRAAAGRNSQTVSGSGSPVRQLCLGSRVWRIPGRPPLYWTASYPCPHHRNRAIRRLWPPLASTAGAGPTSSAPAPPPKRTSAR